MAPRPRLAGEDGELFEIEESPDMSIEREQRAAKEDEDYALSDSQESLLQAARISGERTA